MGIRFLTIQRILMELFYKGKVEWKDRCSCFSLVKYQSLDSLVQRNMLIWGYSRKFSGILLPSSLWRRWRDCLYDY